MGDALDDAVRGLLYPDAKRRLDAADAEALRRYAALRGVLEEAFCRAAFGKGAERHGGGGEDFVDQPIMEIARRVGDGFLKGQIVKKTYESVGMEGERCDAEMLDVAVYACAAVLLRRERG